MAKLVCKSGPNAGAEYRLGKDITVLGRQSSCDIQVADSGASRAHTQVRRTGQLYTLADLGSRNGTILNGRKLASERMLTFGDRIRIGQVEYVLVKEDGDLELKDLLSKYEITAKLGEGGMGIVYKAVQRSMARTVALKVLSPRYAARPKFVERFIREARATGHLGHPNIIQVHDVGTENGIHYFSMEFVDGSNCMDLLRADGPFPVQEAIEIIRQTANALAYAHGNRLIHQDIKPDNIMIGPGNLVKLADLGISRTFDEADADDSGRKVMGTPHYMAPEAALGKKIDHRVDIYALGATLYHLLTGKTPYQGTSATDVLKAHVMDPLPPLQDLNPQVPDDVAGLVERMMAKRPEDRYQTAEEVAAEITRLQGGSGLGRERIAGSETMVLRRFASGKDPSPPGTAAGAPTTGDHTPDVPVRAAGGGMLRAAGWILVLAAVALGGLAVWMLGPWSEAAPAKPAPTTASPAPASQPTRPEPTPARPANDPLREAERRDEQAIQRIGEVLTRDGERTDLAALQGELSAIAGRPLSPVLRQQVDAVRERLEAELSRRRQAADLAAWTAVEKEVRAREAERNYDLALQRLSGYAAPPALAAKVERLREEVEKDRTEFIADTTRRIDGAVKARDAARLRELRDGLPASILGGPIEQRITDALNALDAEAQQKAMREVDECAGELVRWEFEKLAAHHQRLRPQLGASAAGEKLDRYLEASKQLPRLTDALGEVVKKKWPIRYNGMLAGWPDPDLRDVTREFLVLKTADGAKPEVRWSQIQPTELIAIAQLVLQFKYNDHKACLETLTAASVAVGAGAAAPGR